MTVLDTNVVSELMKPSPDSAVVEWSASVAAAEIAITVVTVMEVRHGIARLPAGRRRKNLAEQFRAFCSETVGEILPFDLLAAEEAADYLVERERIGRPLMDTHDAQIAGIVLRLSRRDGRPATLATRNVSDFATLKVVNPWVA